MHVTATTIPKDLIAKDVKIFTTIYHGVQLLANILMLAENVTVTIMLKLVILIKMSMRDQDAFREEFATTVSTILEDKIVNFANRTSIMIHLEIFRTLMLVYVSLRLNLTSTVFNFIFFKILILNVQLANVILVDLLTMEYATLALTLSRDMNQDDATANQMSMADDVIVVKMVSGTFRSIIQMVAKVII